MGFVCKSCILILALSISASIAFVSLYRLPFMATLENFHKTLAFQLLVLIFSLAAICFLVPLIVDRVKAAVTRPQQEPKVPGVFVSRRDAATFEQEKEAYTKKCVERLMQSEAYRRKIEEKRRNEANKGLEKESDDASLSYENDE